MLNMPKGTGNVYESPDTVTGISRLLIKEDTAYMCCSEKRGVSYLASVMADGRNFQKQPLEMEDSVSLLDFTFDGAGNTWTVCMDYAGNYCLK